jgi:hypothetical protein
MVVTKTRRVPQQGSVPQAVAVLVGIVLTLVGGLGFLVTGFDDFAARNQAEQLFGLAVNPLQNVLHLTIGVLGIVLSARLGWARGYGWLLLAGFGVVFVYGVLAVQRPAVDVLNLNWTSNVLHLATLLAGFVTAVGPVKLRGRREVSRSRQ